MNAVSYTHLDVYTRQVLDYGFNKLGVTWISANCYPQNKRSQRVLEKMGFTYEGILHQAEVSYDDKIYDHLCYYLEKNNLDVYKRQVYRQTCRNCL